MKPYFQNDSVVLYHGDSLEVLDDLCADGMRWDLLLTDPPYGVDQGSRKGGGVNAERAKATYEGDFRDDAAYMKEVVRNVVEKSLAACDLGIVTGGVGSWEWLPRPVQEGCMFCPASPSFNRWGHQDYWPIYYYGEPKGNVGTYRKMSHMVTERGFSDGHPCSKPLSFWKKLMLCGTDGVRGKTVLDPFAGSGTTGAAAMQLGMKATLIELNERYCELIARNCSQFYFDL